jgi:hypothetical protein
VCGEVGFAPNQPIRFRESIYGSLMLYYRGQIRVKMRYRVHRFDIDMTRDQRELEQFLNNLEGEVVAIIPTVNPKFTAGGMGAKVNFLLIVEKTKND